MSRGTKRIESVNPDAGTENAGNNPGSDTGSGSVITDATGAIIINPAELGSGTDANGTGGGSGSGGTGEPERKRRGRKPGSRNSPKEKSALDINGVEALLYSGHQMLAAITSVKELQLDAMEANTLARGIANVARHYDLGATQKTLDWANLFQVLALVYGPRLYAAMNKPKEIPQNVHAMQPGA